MRKPWNNLKLLGEGDIFDEYLHSQKPTNHFTVFLNKTGKRRMWRMCGWYAPLYSYFPSPSLIRIFRSAVEALWEAQEGWWPGSAGQGFALEAAGAQWDGCHYLPGLGSPGILSRQHRGNTKAVKGNWDWEVSRMDRWACWGGEGRLCVWVFGYFFCCSCAVLP